MPGTRVKADVKRTFSKRDDFERSEIRDQRSEIRDQRSEIEVEMHNHSRSKSVRSNENL